MSIFKNTLNNDAPATGDKPAAEGEPTKPAETLPQKH
jgi:hypothetical protein